jgi:hypothetical protein
VGAGTLTDVLGEERFWTRRLRWRLRGAWMWPTFAILTVAEGFVLHRWPPTGFRIDDVVIGAILALFGNLFFVGAVAPWIARRLIERDRRGGRERFPPEVYLDRTATTLLVLGFVGVIAAGLGNQRVITGATKPGELARAYVDAHADPEIKRNLDQANTREYSDTFSRICVPRDNQKVQYCMFVDTKRKTVKKDPATTPNDLSAEPNQSPGGP